MPANGAEKCTVNEVHDPGFRIRHHAEAARAPLPSFLERGGKRHPPLSRKKMPGKTQHAAMPDAARCDDQRSTLRWPMHRTALFK